MDILKTIGLRRTAQTEQADPRQVRNSAGGHTFAIDDLARLRRFLVLGVDGGTYYVGAHELAKENAAIVLEFAASRTTELVAEIVAVSTEGRAPRQNPALFALAAATALGDEEGRRAAMDALALVARTGTHLFLFAGYVEQFRGWGRGLRRAVGRWYTDAPVDKVAFQAVKYRQRDGWSHRDLLRLAHPGTTEPDRKALFDWICGRETAPAEHDALRLVEGFQRAQAATSGWAELVTEYGLSWEMLPNAALTEAVVWEALLDKGMPPTALMRQLPRLTRLGLLEPTAARTAAVAERLTDPNRLRTGRVHPLNVLVAQRTYASGRGARGSGTWEPSRPIVDALDAAFYAAFRAITPARKRTMLALDVSGSMAYPIESMPLTCREATAALALVTAATEPAHEIVAFSTKLTRLAISPRQRLDDVLRTVSDLPFGGTDCALPMVEALWRNAEFDTFVVYTDNETWYGDVHPHQALRQYRERMGIDAKLVVVAMTSTGFSIADPNDAGMLDVAGFDSAVPGVITDFSRGGR